MLFKNHKFKNPNSHPIEFFITFILLFIIFFIYLNKKLSVLANNIVRIDYKKIYKNFYYKFINSTMKNES